MWKFFFSAFQIFLVSTFCLNVLAIASQAYSLVAVKPLMAFNFFNFVRVYRGFSAFSWLFWCTGPSRPDITRLQLENFYRLGHLFQTANRGSGSMDQVQLKAGSWLRQIVRMLVTSMLLSGQNVSIGRWHQFSPMNRQVHWSQRHMVNDDGIQNVFTERSCSLLMLSIPVTQPFLFCM